MSGYTVTAPLVVARDGAGRLHHSYRGAFIPTLNEVQRAHFLRHGLVREVASPEDAPAVAPLDALVDKPKRVAPKEEWVNFGVSKGNARADLEGLTKEELVELLGDF